MENYALLVFKQKRDVLLFLRRNLLLCLCECYEFRRMQFLVGCYYGAESETSLYNQKILICHWPQKNAKLKL